jgi:hypothetical protein
LGKIGGNVGYCVGASGFLSFADAAHPLLGDLIGCCWWDCWLNVNVVAELHFLFDRIIVGDEKEVIGFVLFDLARWWGET